MNTLVLGSAIMFEVNKDSQVSSTFLYPTYVLPDGTVDLSGNLTRVPAKETLSFTDFEQLAFDVLDKYPAAKECFNRVRKLKPII